MKRWQLAILAGTLVFGPTVGFAAIDGTHHDMTNMSESAEKCAYCHSKTGLAPQAGLGAVGGFCVAVCHLSGSGVSSGHADVVPNSPGTFSVVQGTPDVYTWTAGTDGPGILSGGHGMDKAALATLSTTEAASVTATGWPHTSTDTLECTSCHAVHDATNPPFLNRTLTDGTNTGGFCMACHTDSIRVQDFAAGAGNHPTEFTWDPTAAALRNTGAVKTDGTVMGNREIAIDAGVQFNLTGPTGNLLVTASAGATDMKADGDHWYTGGKVMNTTVGSLPSNGSGSGTDQFGCYSCHTVHNEVTASNGLASVYVASDSIQDICYGCHTTEPGLTNFGHPIDAETTLSSTHSWTVPLSTEYATMATAGTFAPATGAPYCVSCHDVHDGYTGLMAIRKIKVTQPESACDLCHESSFASPDGSVDQHHPGLDATNYNTADGFPATVAWLTVDGNGDLDDGLACADCHIGDGSATKRSSAHNW